MIMNDIFVLQSLPPKVQIMLAKLFLGKYCKSMLVMTNYAKNYASTIYQIRVPEIFSRVRQLSAAQMLWGLKPRMLSPRLMTVKCIHHGTM